MDALTFRQDFPEFSDETMYPDPQVTFWITLAGQLLNVDRWGTILNFGTELYTAHQLAIQAKNMLTASTGGIPGSGSGVISSKTVDKVSITYDTAKTQLDDGGYWNLTAYGVQFLQLSRMMGAGPIQLTGWNVC